MGTILVHEFTTLMGRCGAILLGRTTYEMFECKEGLKPVATVADRG